MIRRYPMMTYPPRQGIAKFVQASDQFRREQFASKEKVRIGFVKELQPLKRGVGPAPAVRRRRPDLERGKSEGKSSMVN